MAAPACVTALDDNAAAAVLDSRIVTAVGHDAGGISIGGLDGARRMEVLDGGTADTAERSAVVLRGGDVEGDGLAVAVESALEAVSALPHHRGDADVVGQLEVRAGVGCAAVDVSGQLVPVGCCTDLVRVDLSARAFPSKARLRDRAQQGDDKITNLFHVVNV